MIVAIVLSTINDVVTKRRKSQTTTGAPPRRTGPSPQGEATTARGAEGAGGQHGSASYGQPRPADAEQSAQVLLPDDLWAILTGERRPPVTSPAPAEADEGEFEEYDSPDEPAYRAEPRDWDRDPSEPVTARSGNGWPEEDVDSFDLDHDPALTTRSREPRSNVNRGPRELVTRPEREIISLEERYQTGKERHAAFHDNLSSTDSVGLSGAATRRARAESKRRRALHRAIILHEVLGPPKGLEERF